MIAYEIMSNGEFTYDSNRIPENDEFDYAFEFENLVLSKTGKDIFKIMGNGIVIPIKSIFLFFISFITSSKKEMKILFSLS